nr:alkaline phosphatase [uncultured bacterium]
MSGLRRTLVGVLAVSALTTGCAEDGAQGKPGADGAPGENGSDGKEGADGLNGKDGASGSEGPEGQRGPGTSWLSFSDVGFARTNAEKHAVRASSRANLNGKELAIGFKTIIRSGQDPARADKSCDLEASPATCTGAMLDKAGELMRDEGGEPMVSNLNDFSSLLSAGDSKFLVHSYESYPATVYVTKLAQDEASGELSAMATKHVDFSSIDGLYRACAGSITPWGTHISAEEAQVDARTVDAATTWSELMATGRYGEIKLMGRYLGLDLADGDGNGEPDVDVDTFQSTYSSYFHGFAVEVAVDAAGEASVQKHYAMGRMGMELAYVMPDQRTAFLTDDVTNGGLFMFVADEAGKLEAGTLYAMRFHQRTVAGGALEGDIEWVDLGHATNAEIRALIHPASGARIKFQDIFDTEPVNESACSAGFTLVRANGDNEDLECLKLRPGMELAASRLETRRYSVLKGATAELTKEEGLTYDPELNRIYVALSDVSASMAAQSGGDNHIDVAPNRCGGVYALDVGPWVDLDGALVTEYAAVNWYPLVVGQQVPAYPASSPYAGNSCSVGGLASPDNVTYLPKYQTLIIGEDTGRHQNDAMWSYHMPSGRLTRIMTTPYGSETTSPYWVTNFGGYGYLIGAVQHPYGESDQEKLSEPEASGAASWVGVIGPFPALD